MIESSTESPIHSKKVNSRIQVHGKEGSLGKKETYDFSRWYCAVILGKEDFEKSNEKSAQLRRILKEIQMEILSMEELFAQEMGDKEMTTDNLKSKVKEYVFKDMSSFSGSHLDDISIFISFMNKI